jgi:hypothetical protein
MTWNRKRVLVYRQAPAPGVDVDAGAQRAVQASRDRIRVGIWDLDSSAGALPGLLDRIDECQQRFAFSSVVAPFPTGLALPGIGVAEDWRKHTRQVMDPQDARVNVAARRIFEAAGPVLQKLPIEWLIVVVKSMISDTSVPRKSWYNLFATHSNNVVLISTYGVREYAAQAQRSFEAAVFGIALSALLSAMIPEIEYQDESTGSIFDFAENRADVVKSIRAPHIDPENRARIPENLLEPVEKMLAVLKEYKGGAALLPSKAKRPAAKKSRAPAKSLAGNKRPSKNKGTSKVVTASTSKLPENAAGTFLKALKSLNAALKQSTKKTSSQK